ncbi:MAG: hypothetical protein APR63_03075 [Desulfuromonas sp. SDB]|nr:MAG: hypothetical protein APR63_03075 [Desulfuromonas sp. SDB]
MEGEINNSRKLSFIVPVTSMIFHIIPWLFIWSGSKLIYSGLFYIGIQGERIITVSILFFSGLTAILLGVLSCYYLILSACWIRKVTMILIFSFPSLIMGFFYLHALLIFLALV